jgi:hypothetical protein
MVVKSMRTTVLRLPSENPPSRFDRAEFLQLAGRGIGLSLVPSSILFAGAEHAFGATAEILADERFPIGLWWPPPPEMTTTARYEQIRQAGFNFVIGGNGVVNNATNPSALRAAAANGLRFVLTDSSLQNLVRGSSIDASAAPALDTETPSLMRYLLEQDVSTEPDPPSYFANSTSQDEVRTSIVELLNLYGDHPALAGLNLYDEPSSSLFGILGFAKEVLKRRAPRELPYVNVLSSYVTPSSMGAQTYEGYLDRYMSTVRPPLLCFDHYPLLSGGGITNSYFYNWATIRKFALRHGVPSWGFILSVDIENSVAGFADWRRPNKQELLWQVNVGLAYGVKGIQYFTYWTPVKPPDAPVRFGRALVSASGELTPLYHHAKDVNGYLRVMGKEILPLVSESVVHAREERLPWGAKPFKADAYIRSVGGSRIILSKYRKRGVSATRYLFVANRSYAEAAKSRLVLSDSVRGVRKFDIGSGSFTSATLGRVNGHRYLGLRLAPGAARLYMLRT